MKIEEGVIRSRAANVMKLLLELNCVEQRQNMCYLRTYYFHEASLALDHDPLNWCQENNHCYSPPSILAQVCLCILATSVPAECFFPEQGWLWTVCLQLMLTIVDMLWYHMMCVCRVPSWCNVLTNYVSEPGINLCHVCPSLSLLMSTAGAILRVLLIFINYMLSQFILRVICGFVYPLFNPFKPSGVKWLHFRVFKAILV